MSLLTCCAVCIVVSGMIQEVCNVCPQSREAWPEAQLGIKLSKGPHDGPGKIEK